MRLVCRECGDLKELSAEQREKYARIVREDKLTVKEYLALINIALKHKGDCTNVDGHEYTVEETYRDDVEKMISMYKTSISNMVADERSLEDATNTVAELRKTIAEIEVNMKGLVANIKSSAENVEYTKQAFPKLTGIEIESWV
jgi:hypothetical protein